MPKIVDSAARRIEIAEAVYRVIRRDGLAQASLRGVAVEAGLVVGSIRHYFVSHDELILFAVRILVERVLVRLYAHVEELKAPASTREKRMELTERLLGELLPLDAERLAETEVWLAFSAVARTKPKLAEDTAKVPKGTRALVKRLLTEAARGGNLIKKLDVDLETERLAVLLEGLAMAATDRPEHTSPELMVRVLRRHLDSLRR
ncbi:TetR/AcrR family transcriptional regulator [Amycolatopsis sp. H20-H5]|uniref:TetR/AcrR family transcriptional regulator n=1 Tax=Amycolatopsis sp. H20-H5 TaxID=3046309 RepID=UPI002DB58656|nr:TetR/AcrR family transcriptional regulator [Amycolatopsis sp. H20-H5]MEC3979414.1 TetR/AcrR family transcriptional regulator [Amycolatopsis sp. H20-H5]